MQILKVTPTSSRADIELAIATLRTKQQRMPTHWIERRAEVGDAIDELVEQWLTASS